MSWAGILLLAACAYGFKLAGVLVGSRAGSESFERATMLVPPALFSALVIVQTFDSDGSLVFDERVAGLVVAGFLAWRRVGFVPVIVASMVVVAVLRQFGA